MRRRIVGLLVASVFVHAVACAGEAAPVPEFPVADQLVPRDPLPERTLQMADGVVLHTDVVYSTIRGFRPLRLDVYYVPSATKARPLVVFVHGGGWIAGNPRGASAFVDFPSVLAYFAARGYVVASIDYRLSGEAPFPAPYRDVQDAVRFLRANAPRFALDPRRVALWGMSAGAHLAALAAVACGERTFDPPRPDASAESACVQGFVGWFGVYDLARYQGSEGMQNRVSELLDCGAATCSAVGLDIASPTRYIDRADAPVLLIQGMSDGNVPPEQAIVFAESLRKEGVPVELLMLPGVAHGFIGSTPAATMEASRRALSATLEFLDRLFGTTTPSPVVH